MLTVIIRRLLVVVPMWFVISFLVYSGLELTPVDAVSNMISPELTSRITPEQLADLHEAFGVNNSFLERYYIWLSNILQGNFGHSLENDVPISAIIFDRLPATLELSIIAILFSVVIGTLLGIFSALKKNSWFDKTLSFSGIVGISVPEFFFGLVAILLFALNLQWLPVADRSQLVYETMGNRLPYILLPSLVLAIMMTAAVMRYSRSAMLEVLSRNFILTVRAKGLPERRINFTHGFRVALTPIIVLIGLRLPTLISSSIIIEHVFQWPGIGSEFILAVRDQDYPLITMIALLSVFVVLMASLIIDVISASTGPIVRQN